MVDSLGLPGNEPVGIFQGGGGGGGGGGADCEVEPDLCLFAGIDFRGAIRVDIGLGFWQKKKKNERGREMKRSQEFV